MGGTVWIPITNDYDANSITPRPDVIVKNLLEIYNFLPTTNVSALRNNSERAVHGMDDSDDDDAAHCSSRPQRSQSQSTITSGASSSRRVSQQYRRQVSFSAVDFNDSSCDCSWDYLDNYNDDDSVWWRKMCGDYIWVRNHIRFFERFEQSAIHLLTFYWMAI